MNDPIHFIEAGVARSKRTLVLALACSVAFMAGCATLTGERKSAGSAKAASPVENPPLAHAESKEILPGQPLTGQIFYRMMLAEVAGQRGNLQVALNQYLELARETSDPRVIRRAIDVATFAQRSDAGLELARQWLQVSPDSLQARQVLAGLLIATGKLEEARPHVASLLAGEGPHVGAGLLRLNRLFLRTPDKLAALAFVEDVTEPYLERYEAHVARAEAASIARQPERALAYIDKALVRKPDAEQAAQAKAQLLQRQSPDRAREFVRDYLRAYPQASELRLQYARALAAEKKYAEARSQYEKVLAAAPNNQDVQFAVALIALQVKDYAAADVGFRRLLAEDFREPDALRVYLGNIAEERKQWDVARKWYEQVGEGEQWQQAQLRIGHVLAQQGDVEGAARHFTAVATTVTEKAPFVLAHVAVLREAGRTDDAYRLADQALAEAPNNTDLLYESALIAEKLGRLDVLETNLRKVIRLKPEDAHAYNALGYSLADRNLRLDEAKELVARALQLAPEDPFILDSMGWVLYRQSDLNGALSYLQRAYGIRQDPEIAAHLGEVLWMLGRKSDAAKTWKEASAANPGNEVLNGVIKRFQGK